MRSANEKKMFDLLLDEIEETLGDIEQRCLKLDSTDAAKELQVIFRSAHNVKGAAQLYGLQEFGAFIHAFEDVLTALQKAGSVITPKAVDVLLSAQSFARTWVQGLRDNDSFKPDPTAAKQQLARFATELKAPAPAPAPVQQPATPAAQAPAAQAPAAQMPAAQTIEPQAPPPPVALQPSAPVAAPMPASALQTPAPAPPRMIGPNPAMATGPAQSATGAGSPASAPPPPGAAGKAKRAGSTLRISSQKIDEIMQLIGELSIQQGILWHNYQNRSFNSLTCGNSVVLNQKTIKNLYELVLTLRMQPAEALFQRMERTARDVAREQQKSVGIRLLGADTPLDKTVLELITDPMMHIVRNAIDHGVESDEERLKIGKPVPARLTIETSHDSGQVVISITDDGRGLDPQMIYEKAIKRGLVPPGKKMKEQDIVQLLFLPGFSTKDQITHISGRGVGLDVVQKAIQQLGGQIEVKSQKSKGTTFHIRLPASLEITEGLLIQVTDQVFVVPRRDVEEIVDLDSYEIETVGRGSRAIRMRRAIVPLEDLKEYIGLAPGLKDTASPTPPESDRDIALVIRLQDRTRLALRVDAILAQQQIVVRPISDGFAKLPGFTGMTILGNGEPAMILSTSAIGASFVKWVNRKIVKEKDGA